ncbi:hypothetical protein DK853_44060, partial [Klebsiella oxytoca]
MVRMICSGQIRLLQVVMSRKAMVKVMKMLMKQAKVRTSRKLGKRICGRRLNNGGMSLVEVVVAMTIFAVVTVPVLHA